MKNITKKYTNTFSAIHWIHAVIIIMLLVGATLNLPELPNRGADLTPFKGHMILGFFSTILTVIRLILLKKQSKLEPLNMDLFRKSVVAWNHRFIYLFLLLTGVSGMVIAKSTNLGSVVIFGDNPEIYSGSEGIASIFATVHSVSAYILMALVIMHIVGTILYMIKTKENILSRVGFKNKEVDY